MSVEVGAETPDDAAGVHALLLAAFGGSEEADLVTELRCGGHAVAALVVRDNMGVGGYVLFSKLDVIIKGRTVPSAALAPLAVRADLRRRGVGYALVLAGLDVCKSNDIELVVVVGDPAYYSRFGFESRSGEELSSPFAGPAMQVLELRPGVRGGTAPGSITYPQPFARFI